MKIFEGQLGALKAAVVGERHDGCEAESHPVSPRAHARVPDAQIFV